MAEQNDVSGGFFKQSDLAAREQEIVREITARTKFIPNQTVNRSSWWGSSKIGAIHYEGSLEGKAAILKIQGVKPETSEAFMLENFEKHNQSKTIRPPHVYHWIPWDEEKHYEALVLEKIQGPKVVNTPAGAGEIAKFFQVFKEYRANCRQEPWVNKPKYSIPEGLIAAAEKWAKASQEIYPDHPLRQSEDESLLEQASQTLVFQYENVDLEFQHSHFSADDLFRVEDKIVLLSNLYWAWRPPFYDRVFAYHWYTYRLGNNEPSIEPQKVEADRSEWLSHIYAGITGEDIKLLELALLERAAAGLRLDALTVDPKHPIAQHLVQQTREQVRSLIAKLEKN